LPFFFFFFFCEQDEDDVVQLDNQGPVNEVDRTYQRKMPAADEDTNDEGSDDEVQGFSFCLKKILCKKLFMLMTY
jgi:hypothetical protein